MTRFWSLRHLRHYWRAFWGSRQARTRRTLRQALGIPSAAEERQLDDLWEGKP